MNRSGLVPKTQVQQPFPGKVSIQEMSFDWGEELYSGGWPPGERVGFCPKANSKVSAWPGDFSKGVESVKEVLGSVTFLTGASS